MRLRYFCVFPLDEEMIASLAISGKSSHASVWFPPTPLEVDRNYSPVLGNFLSKHIYWIENRAAHCQ